jgi:hypothetical protein
MRTTGDWELLPFASEEVLNEIPLLGISKHGRPEKFFLGKLVGPARNILPANYPNSNR